MAFDRIVTVSGINAQVLLPTTGRVWAMFSHGTTSDYTRKCFEMYVWSADQAVVGYDAMAEGDHGMYRWPMDQDPSALLVGTKITKADGSVNYGRVVSASLRRNVYVRANAQDMLNECLGEETPGGLTYNPPAGSDDRMDIISVTMDRFTPYEGEDATESPAWTFRETLTVQTAGDTRDYWAELGDATSSDVLTFGAASAEATGVRVDAEMRLRYTEDRLILGTAVVDGAPHDIVSVVEDASEGRRRVLRCGLRRVVSLA